MKNRILITLLISLLSGCATERYFGGNGAEALVYKENHNFGFAIKKRAESEQQIGRLIAEIESIDKEATYIVDYKKAQNKKILTKIFAQYPSHLIAPERVEYRLSPSLTEDLTIRATLTRIKTQRCEPAEIGVESGQRNCFVESMRYKQVSYKSKLVGGEE